MHDVGRRERRRDVVRVEAHVVAGVCNGRVLERAESHCRAGVDHDGVRGCDCVLQVGDAKADLQGFVSRLYKPGGNLKMKLRFPVNRDV